MSAIPSPSNFTTAMPWNNATSNTTFQPFVCTPVTPDTSAVRITKAVALCIILSLALVGNTLVIIVISKTKALRRTVNVFILNMSVSDVYMALMAIPSELVTIITGSLAWQVDGVAGTVLCKIVIFLVDSSNAVSILSMVCIAIDRFCAVVLPMKRNLITGKLRACAIILTWVLAAMYTAPNLYTARLVHSDGLSYCMTDWTPLDHQTSVTVNIVMMVVLFMITPWILVAVLYTVMVVEIRRTRRQVAQRARRRSRDLRVLKLALTIITAFSVCNFPICAMYLLLAFKYDWQICHLPVAWPHLFTTAKYLVLANTCLNPYICFAFSENFRKGLRDVTRAQRSFIVTLVGKTRTNSTAISSHAMESDHEFFELKEIGNAI